MERLLNQKVKSQRDGVGIIKSVKASTPSYIIEVEYPNITRKLSFDTVVKNNIINFIDESMQSLAIELVAKNEQAIQVAKEKERKDRERQLKEAELKNIGTFRHTSPSTSTHHGPITELNRSVVYGTRAQTIYEECSHAFGWDWFSRGMFGRQQKLYANRVAGIYSVWFIAHSNYTGDRSNQWKNYINGDTIEEEYEHRYYYCDLKDKRIVFYKNERADYVFAGIYEQESQYTNEKNKMVIVYRRISEKYPI